MSVRTRSVAPRTAALALAILALSLNGTAAGGPITTLMKRALETDQAFAQFGMAGSSAGDVNGDGCDDLVVSAPYYDKDESDEGRIFVYHGSICGIGPIPQWTAEGEQTDVTWTGPFRVSGDGRDVASVEPGASVRFSDGPWELSTGVEVRALADGSLEHTYYRNGTEQPFDAEAREFLAEMLRRVVRWGGRQR